MANDLLVLYADIVDAGGQRSDFYTLCFFDFFNRWIGRAGGQPSFGITNALVGSHLWFQYQPANPTPKYLFSNDSTFRFHILDSAEISSKLRAPKDV
jgi:hypothetical protein